jgi:hypothetical protein
MQAPLEDFKNRVKITKSSRPFSLGFLPKVGSGLTIVLKHLLEQ